MRRERRRVLSMFPLKKKEFGLVVRGVVIKSHGFVEDRRDFPMLTIAEAEKLRDALPEAIAKALEPFELAAQAQGRAKG